MTCPEGTSSLAISSTETFRFSYVSATSTGFPTTFGTEMFSALQKLPKVKNAQAKQIANKATIAIQMYFCGRLAIKVATFPSFSNTIGFCFVGRGRVSAVKS